MKRLVDLHMHSIYSDGQFDPKELIELAKKNNVGIISITDHDDIRSVNAVKQLKVSNINYINGVELSAITNVDGENKRIHILGYGYDEKNEHLLQMLENKRKLRNDVNKRYLMEMLKEFSFLNNDILEKIECDKYINFSRLIIKHVEAENYSLGQLEDIQKYLNSVKILYPDYEFSDELAINLILEAGGFPILAHPYQYNLSYEQEEKLLIRLKALGLVGIEKYHSGDTAQGMRNQEKLCDKYELEWTVGSDFHTDYDDCGNEIGLGKNNNLCKDDCSLIKKMCLNKSIYRR